MDDLDFQVQTIFFESNIISKASHYGYIIYFRFFEFLELDYVKINTKIKINSVPCIQPEILKVIQNSCLTLTFKVNYEGQVTYVSHFEILNIRYVWIDSEDEPVSRIQTMMNKGSQ